MQAWVGKVGGAAPAETPIVVRIDSVDGAACVIPEEIGPTVAVDEDVAGRPRCAVWGDFEVYVAEKSRLRLLRGWVERGQEFLRARNSLLLPLRQNTMGLKTRNHGPGRRLSGNDRFTLHLDLR